MLSPPLNIGVLVQFTQFTSELGNVSYNICFINVPQVKPKV